MTTTTHESNLEVIHEPLSVRRLMLQFGLQLGVPGRLRKTSGMGMRDLRELEQRRLNWARCAAAYGMTFSDATTHIAVSEEGHPIVSAEAKRRKAIERGCEIVVGSSDGESCTLQGRRTSTDEWSTVTFSRKDAQRSGEFDITHTLLNHDGSTSGAWREVFFDVVRDTLITSESFPPWLHLRVRKEWNSFYWSHPADMFRARATHALIKFIDPIQAADFDAASDFASIKES
jgi:hypothetical protein